MSPAGVIFPSANADGDAAARRPYLRAGVALN